MRNAYELTGTSTYGNIKAYVQGEKRKENEIMKKIRSISLLLLTLMLAVPFCASGEAAFDVPETIGDYAGIADYDIGSFCVIKTKTFGDETTITLSKEVDSIRAGWMGYAEETEELIPEDLTVTIRLTGHNYQPGSTWTNGYWTPYTWEDEHDVYFGFDDTQDEINQRIAEVRDYLNSGEYQKTKEAQKLLSFAKDVKEETVVEMPTYAIYTVEEVEQTMVIEGEDGEPKIETGTVEKRNNLEVFEYGTDMETIRKAYDEWVKRYPDLEIYLDESEGHAWGRLIGRDYYESVGAPNYAYVTQQGDFKVVYGRNGTIQYFEKTIQAIDLFGVGNGKATIVYRQNNAGWYPAKVRMEFEGGEYRSITANYDGNGRLYGIGVKLAE